MTTRRPNVSDHAMLRYLERVVGIDVAQHRRDVEAKVAIAIELKACALTSGGYRYVIAGGRVVTVMPVSSHPQYTRASTRSSEDDQR